MLLGIKRPLVWLFLAYMSGVGLYKVKTGVAIIIVCIVMILVVLWGSFFWSKRKGKLIHFAFLLGLPFLFGLGYLRMNQQLSPASMDSAFSVKINGTISGHLDMIEEKGQYTILTLKANSITLEQSSQELLSQGQSSQEQLSQDKSSQEQSEYDSKSYFSNKLTIYSTSKSTYKIGNILFVSGQIVKFQKASNPGQFNQYQYNKMNNIEYKVNAKKIEVLDENYSWFHHLLYRIKKKFVEVYQEILPKKDAGLMSAMILGDMALLDDDIKELYQQNGISHILAISGLNVSLLGISLFQLLRKARISILPSTIISIFIIFSYGILTNFSVSTNRAVVMLILFMIAGVIGRTYDLLSATSLSALIILIQSPMQIYNAGFLLSFGAMLGIALIYPILTSIIPIKNIFLDGLWLSISIQCMTFPIIVYFFYEFPLYSVVINMIILPLSSIIVLMGIIAGILGCLYLPAGIFAIGCVHYILSFYEIVCRIGSELPGKTFLTGRPSVLIVITYYSIILLFIALNNGIKRKLSVILLSFLIIILVKFKNIDFIVTFLDMGQGDGIIMQTPAGTTFLIDGGSTDIKKVGQYRLEPFLKVNGIWELDYAIVTHTDADHVNGLKELIEAMKDTSNSSNLYEGNIVIRHLILPNTSFIDNSYTELITLAKSKGIEVLYIEKGDVIQDSAVTITCLHPSHGYDTTSKNAYSTVLSVSYGQFDLLLTGDLEADGEELVMKELQKNVIQKSEELLKVATDYDVLKVAHHGSKYSTFEEFLNIVKPEFAVISCGKENSYGHPHADLLKRLEKVGSDIRITTECGAINIKTDGEEMIVENFLN